MLYIYIYIYINLLETHEDEWNSYLKEVMDTRAFKLLHWHIVAFINLIISDYAFERPLCVALVQHQVRRMIRQLWQMRLARSLGWRGSRISLDGMNCLDGLHVNWKFVQIYCRGCKLGNLGKRSLVNLARFLLFRTSTTWKVVQIHNTRYRLRFSLLCLDRSFLDDWWSSGILVPTSYGFFLILPHYSHSCDKGNQVKRKNEKNGEVKTSRMDDAYFGE